ncbi:MAG: LytR/AlgR family response regulator transcription factor [Cognaticolwellia sp.]
MFKVLIADDEPLARESIKLLLAEQTDIAEVIEAEDGNQALLKSQQHQPELIFLDIQMPGQIGIKVAEQLPKNCVVIFVTAYDEYAVLAFELNAVDYLLKPFDDARFFQALERARKKILGYEFIDYKKVGQLIQHLKDEQEVRYKNRLIIKDPGRIRLIDVEQVNYITGAGNYAELHLLDGTSILHRETLTALEQQLDPEVFVRIHRSSIVRSCSVSELKPNENGDYTVILKNKAQLTLSRRNKLKLEAIIGKS